MLAFYRKDGPFVAAAIQEPRDGVTIVGDFQFLMQLTNGSSSWLYFLVNFGQFDDGTIQVVRLPDSEDVPPTLGEALRIREALDEPEFRVFDAFEFIGPMMMALFPAEFENWISTTNQTHRASDFERDVDTLRSKLPKDLAAQDYEHCENWSVLIDDFVDHYELKFESEFSSSGERQVSLLIQLAPGDYVELSGFEDDETPTAIDFHGADKGESSALVARWIESHHGGYAAAVALLVEPDEESDEEDDELLERLDEMKRSFWGISDNCNLTNNFSVLSRDEELVKALVQTSPQFAEFKRIIENPDAEEYQLLLELAKREHRGFAGRMGMFAEWSKR